MISVDRHGPVSRTYEEDDEINSEPIALIEYHVSYINEVNTEIETLIVGADHVGSALTPAFIESFKLQLIGSIRSPTELVSNLYYQADSKVLLATHEKDVPVESTSGWLKRLMTLKPKFVISIGSLNISNFNGEREYETGTIRKLESAKSSSTWTQYSSLLSKIRPLETGNVVTGKTAAVLTHCEARCIPSVAFITITTASLSFNALKVFEQIWPFFQSISSTDELRKPTMKEYNATIKANSFMSVTENMYC